MVQVRLAGTGADFDAVRRLCWAYRDLLLGLGGRDAAATTAFYPEDRYRSLMAQLETVHAAPGGAVALAELGGEAVGCGMFHTFAPGVAEIKRVYIADAARGQGLVIFYKMDLRPTGST